MTLALPWPLLCVLRLLLKLLVIGSFVGPPAAIVVFVGSLFGFLFLALLFAMEAITFRDPILAFAHKSWPQLRFQQHWVHIFGSGRIHKEFPDLRRTVSQAEMNQYKENFGIGLYNGFQIVPVHVF